MATNFIQKGYVLTLTAPTGGVVTGVPLFIGGLFVVPLVTVAAGVPFAANTVGVWQFPKPTGEVWAEGQAAFWDTTNLRASTDPTVGLPIGAIVQAQLTADVLGNVRLNGRSLSGTVQTARRRFTVAQVNAGVTLLAAAPGIKYRMIDATATAIGGNASAVTTVDIKATQATVAVKLVAFAQASLTQSTVLRAGGAGAAVLADGASFVANDANTAITVGVTGAPVATATNIDISFTYSIE